MVRSRAPPHVTKSLGPSSSPMVFAVRSSVTMVALCIYRIKMIRPAQNKKQLQRSPLSAANYIEHKYKLTKSSVGIGDIAEVWGTRPYDRTR